MRSSAETFGTRLQALLDGILAFALVAELVALFGNVATRAVLGTSLPWTQEVAELALAVLAFVGGAAAYPKGQHISVKAGMDLMPERWRGTLAAFADWVVVGVGFGGSLLSISNLERNWGELTSILGIPRFWFVLPLTAGMALLGIFALQRVTRHPRSTAIGTGAAFLVVVAVFIAVGQQLGSSASAGAVLWLTLGSMAGLLLAGVPIGFVLAAVSGIYLYLGRAAPLTTVPLTMESGTNSFLLLAIPFFILAGYLMKEAGLTKPLTVAVDALIGHLRGGLLQVLVVTMYIFSGISGSKIADIAAVGTTMKDMLLRQGYDRREITAVLSASAVMGETVPPSLAMLILGSITTLSMGALFVAGLLPAVLMGLCIAGLIYVRAGRQRQSRTPMSWATRSWLVARAFPTLLVPIILVGGILFGVATPTEVSSFAVVYALVLGALVYRTLSFRALWRTLADTASMAGMVLFIVGASMPFAWVVTLAGVPQQIGEGLRALGGAPWLFLLGTVLTLTVMGQLLEGIPALLIFGPLLIPMAQEYHIDPLHYGIVLIIAMGLGAFSPPVGIGLYVACAIGETTIEQSIRYLVPYLVALFVGLLVVAFVPWVSLVLPHSFGLGG